MNNIIYTEQVLFRNTNWWGKKRHEFEGEQRGYIGGVGGGKGKGEMF